MYFVNDSDETMIEMKLEKNLKQESNCQKQEKMRKIKNKNNKINIPGIKEIVWEQQEILFLETKILFLKLTEI